MAKHLCVVNRLQSKTPMNPKHTARSSDHRQRDSVVLSQRLHDTGKTHAMCLDAEDSYLDIGRRQSPTIRRQNGRLIRPIQRRMAYGSIGNFTDGALHSCLSRSRLEPEYRK